MTSLPRSSTPYKKRPGAFFAAPGLLLAILLFCVSQAGAASKPDQYELLAQGTSLVQLDRLDEAAAVFEQVPAPAAGEDAGAFVQSHIGAAKIYFSKKDYQGSMRLCREILSVLPDNLEAKNMLSQAQVATTPEYLRFLKDMKTFFPTLVKATSMTLLLVFITMIVSPLCGLFVALGRISRNRALSSVFWFYIWIFRGTPLLLQLFFIYYGLPSMGIVLDPFTAAVLGLGLNYSAYLAEIMRGAIESIEAGQMEAAKAIGMTYWQAMRRIIVPQTYKRLVPPVGNEFIALIKDTALVSTIAMVELMRAANQIFSATFNIYILVQAAIIYLILTSIFTVAFRRLEDRLGVYENR
jgi:polar amino acid transport system permease protein